MHSAFALCTTHVMLLNASVIVGTMDENAMLDITLYNQFICAQYS